MGYWVDSRGWGTSRLSHGERRLVHLCDALIHQPGSSALSPSLESSLDSLAHLNYKTDFSVLLAPAVSTA